MFSKFTIKDKISSVCSGHNSELTVPWILLFLEVYLEVGRLPDGHISSWLFPVADTTSKPSFYFITTAI